MVEVSVINKLYDNKGKLYAYKIQYENGNIDHIYAEALKDHIRNGNCKVTNMNLTSDNRLVSKKIEQELNDAPKLAKINNPYAGLIPSICGVQIKNIRTGHGREGEYYYGTVYLMGRKLGTWSQDPYGCIVDNYEFDENILKTSLDSYRHLTGNTAMSMETFMLKVVILTEYYKLYKKMVREGKYKILTIVTDKLDYQYSAVTHNSFDNNTMNGISKIANNIAKNGMGSVIIHFKCEEDFCIN